MSFNKAIRHITGDVRTTLANYITEIIQGTLKASRALQIPLLVILRVVTSGYLHWGTNLTLENMMKRLNIFENILLFGINRKVYMRIETLNRQKGKDVVLCLLTVKAGHFGLYMCYSCFM